MLKRQYVRGGFALPTVLIASVVMLIVLSVSISSVAAVRTTLKGQYYSQLAKAAGEAGVAYAKACLAKNGNVPLWTDAKPLRPSTDCAGNNLISNNPFRTLIVGGGGSGGGSTGGGGGGGGVLSYDFFSLAEGSYPVVVGMGAVSPGNQLRGKTGANSTFYDWVAVGGGGGAHSAGNVSGATGLSGGSGGGGQNYYGTNNPGAGTPGQGYQGGPLANTEVTSATGGGGAGGPGSGSSFVHGGGNGGPGVMSTISGATVYYGGGGGGGGSGTHGGAGGIGGGGNGADVGLAGQPNTGGGGGGGWSYATGDGGAGGSGVVIISYPDNGSVEASGGSQIYSTGGMKVHIFKSSGVFEVTSVQNSTCPTDPRCSVVANDTLRSSFKIGKPPVDADGRALAIPNTGYVELLRASNGAVWRTYQQPAVQSVAVPDLCSGAATSALGWQGAVVASAKEVIPNATAAQTIALADGGLPAGRMYFRKDVNVAKAGTYTLSVLTNDKNTKAEAYIDGQLVAISGGALSGGSAGLAAGCHTLTVLIINEALAPHPARFTAAFGQAGAAPLAVTDTSWRVSAGATVHFSHPDYYANPAVWASVVSYSPATAQELESTWTTISGDAAARVITPAGNGCPLTCPNGSSGYLRDSKNITVSVATPVMVTALCDDDCAVYMDGQVVISAAPWKGVKSQSLTLTPGAHRFAIRAYNSPTYNGSTVANPLGAAMSVVASGGTVLTHTDASWLGANVWTPGSDSTANIQSYEASFLPSPND